MDIIIDIIEIIITIVIIGVVGKYILFSQNLLTMFIPTIILKFILLAIAISIIQYIVSRKDD